MAFYNKFLILILFLLPSFIFAKSNNYLLVTGSYSRGSYKIDNIESRIFDSSGVHIYSTGQYQIKISDSNGSVTNNFFEIVENQTREVIIKDNKYSTFSTSSGQFSVIVPVADNFTTDNSSIQLLKDSKIIIDQKISNLPFQNLIVKKDNQDESAIPFPSISPSISPVPSPGNSISLWMITVYILIAVILIGVIIWFIRKKSADSNNNIPPQI